MPSDHHLKVWLRCTAVKANCIFVDPLACLSPSRQDIRLEPDCRSAMASKGALSPTHGLLNQRLSVLTIWTLFVAGLCARTSAFSVQNDATWIQAQVQLQAQPILLRPSPCKITGCDLCFPTAVAVGLRPGQWGIWAADWNYTVSSGARSHVSRRLHPPERDSQRCHTSQLHGEPANLTPAPRLEQPLPLQSRSSRPWGREGGARGARKGNLLQSCQLNRNLEQRLTSTLSRVTGPLWIQFQMTLNADPRQCSGCSRKRTI